MWHALVEEENRDVPNVNENFINENKQKRVIIHKHLTNAFESEHVVLAHISDLYDVNFDIEDQV